jgi:Flp pilus assembly protein TadD
MSRRSVASKNNRVVAAATRGAKQDGHVPDFAGWVLSGLILLITVVVYAPAVTGEFVWDDDFYVSRNAVLESLDGLRRIWFDVGATVQYYPLVFTTFWIEHQVWGNDPVGYHLVNILLHGLAAVLLGRLLRSLNVPGAWLAAVLFAVHPVHVESVAWVTERKNVLSLCFYLGAAMAYVRYARLDAASCDAASLRRGRYALALVLFIAALLSKTATVGFPIAMLLLIWWKRGRVGAADVARLGPFFAASLVAGLTTAYVESRHVGVGDVSWTLSVPQRCLLAGQSLWFYLSKLAWPASLTFVYGRWEVNPSDWPQFLYPASAVLVLTVLWIVRNRIGRGPFAAMAYFIVSLAPALGFVKFFFMNYSYVGDHFQYLASIGPIALGAAVLQRLADGAQSTLRRVSVRGVEAAIVCSLGVFTFRRCAVFQNIESLFQDVLAKTQSPRARWMAHFTLGSYYTDSGRPEHAAKQYQDSLLYEPTFPDARNRLAVALHHVGRTDEAIAQAREALRLRSNYAEAASNLGFFLEAQGRLDEAAQAYRRAIEIDGNLAGAYINLAFLLLKQGRNADAAAAFRQVLRIDPANEVAAGELARIQGGISPVP